MAQFGFGVSRFTLAFKCWTRSEKATASHTFASTSLITPEAGIEFRWRGVDEAFAVSANQRQFHTLAPRLRFRLLSGGWSQYGQQPVALLWQFLRPAHYDLPVINFDFNCQITQIQPCPPQHSRSD